MSKHRKRWSAQEKLEIYNHYKVHGAAVTSREYEVSVGSIYRWKEAYETKGESGLSGKANNKADRLAFKKLKRENDELKKIIAEKELRLRIQAEMLKKSR